MFIKVARRIGVRTTVCQAIFPMSISLNKTEGSPIKGLVLPICAWPKLTHRLRSELELPTASIRKTADLLVQTEKCQSCTAVDCKEYGEFKDLHTLWLLAGWQYIGSWAFSGMIDLATKALMERFWTFRHHHLLTQGRVGSVVVAGSNTELAGKHGDSLLQFMQNSKIRRTR